MAHHGTKNKDFLNSVTLALKTYLLSHIATQYGIDNEQAFSEVTDKKAESLLDYLKEPQRSATYDLMQKFVK
jgi:hypothetical protein